MRKLTATDWGTAYVKEASKIKNTQNHDDPRSLPPLRRVRVPSGSENGCLLSGKEEGRLLRSCWEIGRESTGLQPAGRSWLALGQRRAHVWVDSREDILSKTVTEAVPDSVIRTQDVPGFLHFFFLSP